MKTLIALFAVLTIACGDSPTTPSQAPPVTAPPPPAPTLYTVTGTVTSLATTAGIQGATVRIADGPNAGLSSTTTSDGRYTLSGLTFAGFSVGVTAPGFVASSRGVPLSATTTTANFTLLPEALWSHSGTGNTVFTMPAYFARVRIVGSYTGFCENFIVRIGGRSALNEILGTCSIASGTRYDGVHLTNGGGTVEITSSTGVSWSFVEQR